MPSRIAPIDNLPNENSHLSLVERVFPHPDQVSEGEYIALYEFLLNPDISNDPEMIAGVLREFSGWAEYPLQRMRETGLINDAETDD